MRREVTRESGRTFGRYQLLEPIAKGGMAEVWRAKLLGAESFERPMVIKRILPHLCDDPAFVRMFVAEARLSARLHHPNIVQVFELGDVDGELFMALEPIIGVDLVTLMRTVEGPLPPGLAVQVAHDVCRALGYAHGVTGDAGEALSIVHRDVSPSNVMLGYDGQVRLCDFGIAKALGAAEQRTRSGDLKGKLGYLAPEFVDGAAFDHRSDLFAVGVLLWEMLSGRRLFRAADDMQTLAAVRACVVPKLSDVPPELAAVTLRALERDPRERFQHADEMIAQLAPLLHDLRWGARETTAVLRELVPPEEDGDDPGRATVSQIGDAGMLPSARVAASGTPSPTLSTRLLTDAGRPRRAWLAGAALLLAVGLAGGWRVMRQAGRAAVLAPVTPAHGGNSWTRPTVVPLAPKHEGELATRDAGSIAPATGNAAPGNAATGNAAAENAPAENAAAENAAAGNAAAGNAGATGAAEAGKPGRAGTTGAQRSSEGASGKGDAARVAVRPKSRVKSTSRKQREVDAKRKARQRINLERGDVLDSL